MSEQPNTYMPPEDQRISRWWYDRRWHLLKELEMGYGECPACSGKGTISREMICGCCGGTGGSVGNPDPGDDWICDCCYGSGYQTVYEPCSVCDGSGEVPD